MIICNDGHRQIVYDDEEQDSDGNYLYCPMCECIREIKNMKEALES